MLRKCQVTRVGVLWALVMGQRVEVRRLFVRKKDLKQEREGQLGGGAADSLLSPGLPAPPNSLSVTRIWCMLMALWPLPQHWASSFGAAPGVQPAALWAVAGAAPGKQVGPSQGECFCTCWRWLRGPHILTLRSSGWEALPLWGGGRHQGQIGPWLLLPVGPAEGTARRLLPWEGCTQGWGGARCATSALTCSRGSLGTDGTAWECVRLLWLQVV
jgi:hypothetical protein